MGVVTFGSPGMAQKSYHCPARDLAALYVIAPHYFDTRILNLISESTLASQSCKNFDAVFESDRSAAGLHVKLAGGMLKV
jgi:hypothetical protein